MSAPVSAITVANTLLEFAAQDQRSVTHMELQKHTFFAHAWYLGNTESPLINDEVQAWKFGPVIPQMYHAFKGFGNNPIDKYGVEYDKERCELVVPKLGEDDSNLRVFLRRIWDAYKGFNAGRLSSISHEVGGPWHQVYQESVGGVVKNLVIPNNIIANFYKQLLQKRPHV